jgi:ABC-2 type transport system permease protein
MRRFLILSGHELRSLLGSPVTWVIIGLAWFLFGLRYTGSILPGATHAEAAATDLLHVTWLSSLHAVYLMILFVPLLTMRLLAEEKRTGTFEMLVTAPVRDHEIVLAKFCGAVAATALTWAVVPLNAVVIRLFGGDPDFGCVLASYGTLLGIGSLFCASGLFASALTPHQLLAGFIALVLIMVLLFAPGLAEHLPTSWITLRGVLAAGDLLRQAEEAARGLVDLVNITYQAAATGFFLLVTVRVVEARKWA